MKKSKVQSQQPVYLTTEDQRLYNYLVTYINAFPRDIKEAYKGKSTISISKLVETLSSDRYKEVQSAAKLVSMLEIVKGRKGDLINTYYIIACIYKELTST
jgi:DNA replication initiation complex subunit (GINS family)